MEILHNHQDYDILEYPVYVHYGSSSKQKLLTFQPSVYRCMTDYWFETKAYQHTYAWNKIYKRELFCSVSFPEGRLFEDVFTLPKLLDKCMTIATTDKGLYYYFDNEWITYRRRKRTERFARCTYTTYRYKIFLVWTI